MKVSEWLREYQITGLVPDHPGENPMLAFWAGWIMGNQGKVIATSEQRLAAAIQCAEFIEAQK